MLVVALCICLESKGAPIFRKIRIGKDEARFTMFKFRSMFSGATSPDLGTQKQVLYKKPNDARITKLGSILRKLCIDELPQLWNVVRGEMSLVGPRPPIMEEYEQMNWYHRRKFEATPGMTGLWQITGRIKNQRDYNAVAAYDVHYIETWCLAEDIRILLKTIPVVVFRKGAC
jgi:lipopolysaccharide/colanic/teichoic acid biosynthesis glycosyltransferase